MLKKLLILLLVVVLGVALLATRQPDSYTVERRISVNAPPEAVFAQINDFHKWEAWSPWAKLDPAMKTTYSGAPAGPGAVYEWTGNSDVGSGRMEIKQSMAPSEVTIALHFMEPIDSESITSFQMTPNAGGTDVIWTMRGSMEFISKVMGVFSSMDAMIGPDFEKGLAQLKSAAEAK
jgi:carbon monoxide dehydrogenase subunit G